MKTMKTMKKAVAVSLAFALVIGTNAVLPQSAIVPQVSAAQTVQTAEVSGDYTYELINDGKEVKITDYKGKDKNVVIPGEIEGKPVTVIGASSFGGSEFKTLTIPDSVTVIESEAFFWNGFLESVDFGNGLKTIGSRAFEFCVRLKSLNFPDSLTTIEDSAFDFCEFLKEVRIGKGLEYAGSYAIAGCIEADIYCYENTYGHEFAKRFSKSTIHFIENDFVITMSYGSPYTMFNGEKVENKQNENGCSQMLLIQNRSLVPLRHICELTGWQVEWVAEDMSIDLINPQTNEKIRLGIDKNSALKYDGEGNVVDELEFDVAPMLVGGITMIPLRQVVECFGYCVEYCEQSYGAYVVISSNDRSDKLDELCKQAYDAGINQKQTV